MTASCLCTRCNHTTVLACNEETGLCEIAHTVQTDLPIQDLRGGTNLQLVNGAYVGFLHTTKPLQYDTYLYAFSATPPLPARLFPRSTDLLGP